MTSKYITDIDRTFDLLRRPTFDEITMIMKALSNNYIIYLECNTLLDQYEVMLPHWSKRVCMENNWDPEDYKKEYTNRHMHK